MKVCVADGCDRPIYARGMCSLHYQRARKLGAAWNAARYCKVCSAELPADAYPNQVYCYSCAEVRRKERNRRYTRKAQTKPRGAWRTEVLDCVVCGAGFLRGDRSVAALTCSGACSLERRRQRLGFRKSERKPKPVPVQVEVQEDEEATDWVQVLNRIAESSGPAAARRALDLLMAQRQRAGGRA